MTPSEVRLGSAAGAAFRFQDGLLADVEIARANLTLPIRETLSRTTTRDDSFSCGGVRVDLDTRDTIEGIKETQSAQQSIGGLTRTFAFENQLTSVAPWDRLRGQRLVIGASLSVAFAPDTAFDWTLTIDEVAHWNGALSSSLEVTLLNGTRVELSVTGGVLSTAKPDGDDQAHSSLEARVTFGPDGGQVELTLTCAGATMVGDTVVICRPDQLRQAAVAISAAPDRRYVPLIVIPRIDDDDRRHQAYYGEYAKLVDQTLDTTSVLGFQDFADGSTEEKTAFLELTRRRRELMDLLAPRRAIAKRNAMLRHALRDLGVRRAILLVEPSPAELAISAPEVKDAGEDDPPRDGPSLLGEDVERIVLLPAATPGDAATTYDGLEDLARKCAVALGGDPATMDWVTASTANPADIVVALHQARLKGALLAIPETVEPPPPPVRVSGPEPRENHVVLVEVRDDAQCLVGAVYAAHLETRLVVRSPPALEATEAALDTMQDAVVAYYATYRDTAPTREKPSVLERFVSGARRLILNDGRTAALRAIGEAVTAATPVEARQAVGKASLTAFTTGLPYSFVSDRAHDWSTKPIGHIIEDPDLHLLNDFAGQATLDPLASFNLIIDPGYFRNSETDDVMASLKGRPSRTLVLRSDGAAATFAADSVNRLMDALPTEFLFFNTHGDDQGIMLGAYHLPAHFIPQWMQLPERPFVFNNSCLSWIGVGRQFVRVGSRAYVGTLWSVDAKAAAEIGRSMVHRLSREGVPFGEVLVRPHNVAATTSRAYIGVGTAVARYPGPERYRAAGSAAAAVAELERLLSALCDARKGLHAEQISKHIYAEFLAGRRALAKARPAECGLAVIRLILHEIYELREQRNNLNLTPAVLREVVAEGEAVLKLCEPLDAQMLACRVELLATRAKAREQNGDFSGAIEDLRACVADEHCPKPIADAARRNLIDIMLNNGPWEEALTLAIEMRDEAKAAGDKVDLMMALGRIAQLMKRLPGRIDEGVEAAREGERLAEEMGILVSQATFAIDLAGLFAQAGRIPEAMTAGLRALRLGRRSKLATAELAAYGTLGGIYRLAGDLDRARRFAERGLRRAIELNLPARVSSFLADLALLDENRTDLKARVDRDLEVLEKGGDSIAPLQRGNLLGSLIDSAAKSRDQRLLMRATLLTPAHLISDVAAISMVSTALMSSLSDIATDLPRHEAVALLAPINRGAFELINRFETDPRHGPACEIWGFTGNLTGALCLALAGRADEARTMAERIEGRTRAHGMIRDLVEQVLLRPQAPDEPPIELSTKDND